MKNEENEFFEKLSEQISKLYSMVSEVTYPDGYLPGGISDYLGKTQIRLKTCKYSSRKLTQVKPEWYHVVKIGEAYFMICIRNPNIVLCSVEKVPVIDTDTIGQHFLRNMSSFFFRIPRFSMIYSQPTGFFPLEIDNFGDFYITAEHFDIVNRYCTVSD